MGVRIHYYDDYISFFMTVAITNRISTIVTTIVTMCVSSGCSPGLETVLEFDQVVVLDAGEVEEQDAPVVGP